MEVIQTIAIAAVLTKDTALVFFVELEAGRLVESLREMGQTKTEVWHKGQIKEVPTEELVNGKVVILYTGIIETAD